MQRVGRCKGTRVQGYKRCEGHKDTRDVRSARGVMGVRAV